MATFNNALEVPNQAGQQIVNGDVNFYIGESTSDRRQKLGLDQQLDHAILESLAFPEMPSRRMDIQSPYRQTCQWIFEHKEYQHWNTSPSGLLWIKGKPGAGKSTLKSHLYRSLRHGSHENPVTFLEFFFSARGTDLQRTLLGMFRSLLNQIFCQNRDVRETVRKPCREKCAAFGGQSSKLQWQLFELESLLTDVVLVSARRQRTLILIDALDEAGEQAAREIAHYFHELQDKVLQRSAQSETLGVKICISCRHYPIVSFFQASQICVEDHNLDDIVSYVKDHLRVDRSYAVDKGDTYVEWQELVQHLADTARGIFQWVRVVVQLIEQRRSRGDSPRKIRQWLSHVPRDLSQVYEQILTDVVDRDDRNDCLWLFKWTCLAVNPLSLAELRGAFAIRDAAVRPVIQTLSESDDEILSQIKAWSGGLIEVIISESGWTSIIQVIHQSVNDYILKEGFQLLDTLCELVRVPCLEAGKLIGVGELVKSYHGHLYQSCLNYLRKVSQQEKLLPFDAEGCSKTFLHQTFRLYTVYRFFQYASTNVLYHARQAGGHRGLDLQEELERLYDVVGIVVGIVLGTVMYMPEFDFWRGMSPLHVAAFIGSEALVTYMLEHDMRTNVHAKDAKGRIALSIAIKYDHLAAVKAFACAGPTAREEGLELAAKHGRVGMFNLFLKSNAHDDNYKNHLSNALCEAVLGGATIIAQACINEGTDVNFQSASHGCALHIASREGKSDLVHMLIKAGADVNAQGKDHGSALLRACFHRKTDIMRILIEAGADINTPEISDLFNERRRYISSAYAPDVLDILRQARAEKETRQKLS